MACCNGRLLLQRGRLRERNPYDYVEFAPRHVSARLRH